MEDDTDTDLTMMMGEGRVCYASTESAEVSKLQGDSTSALGENVTDHEETFHCLTHDKCTEWYLIVQVGNSQV